MIGVVNNFVEFQKWTWSSTKKDGFRAPDLSGIEETKKMSAKAATLASGAAITAIVLRALGFGISTYAGAVVASTVIVLTAGALLYGAVSVYVATQFEFNL